MTLKTPLKIFGPEGIVELVDRTLAMLEFDIGYRIAHHDEMTKGPNSMSQNSSRRLVHDQRRHGHDGNGAPARLPDHRYRLERQGLRCLGRRYQPV